MNTLAAHLLLLLAVAFQAPGIDGPDRVKVSTLAVLAAPPAAQNAWVVTQADVSSVVVDGGTRLVLTSGKPGPVLVLLFQARLTGDKLEVEKLEHTVTFEGPPPAPGPAPGPEPAPPPPGPSPQSDLAAGVRADFERAIPPGPSRRSVARALAANYRAVAGQVARALALPDASPLKSISGILAATTTVNRLTVPDDPDGRFRTFFVALAQRLTVLGLTEAGQLVPVWEEIAAGLELVQP